MDERRGCPLVVIIAAVVLVGTVGACAQGERLLGPQFAIQNGSDRALLFRAVLDGPRRYTGLAYSVGPGEIDAATMPNSALDTKLVLEIVDPSSCEARGRVLVDFGASSYPMVIVPSSGPASVVEADKIVGVWKRGDLRSSPDPCSATPSPT
jgi:hypothetical protein